MIYSFAFLAILVSTFLGFLLLQFLDREKKLLFQESLGLSYGLGLGVITVIMTCLSFAGFNFNIFNTLTPFIFILILCGIFGKVFLKSKVKYPKINPVRIKMNRIELFFWGAILFEVFLVFFVSMIKPVEAYDAVAHWAAKAKILYFLGNLPLDIFSKPCIKTVAFTGDYPWLWPFIQNYIHNFIGCFNDFAPKIITPLFFVSCLVIFYNILRRINLKRLHAIIFTFFLASTPLFNNQASIGYADLILGFYYSVGFLYLYLWFNENNKIYLLLSAIFTALACYVKCEGVFLASINVMTFLSFILFGGVKNKGIIFKDFIFYIFILALLSLPMFLLRQATCANLSNHTVNISVLSDFKVEKFWRISSIMYAYQKQFFNIKSWNFTWVLFITSVILTFIRKTLFAKELKFLTIAIGLIFLGHIFVYIISPDVGEALRTLSRLLLHFLPLVMFFIARAFALEEERYSRRRVL